MYIPQTSDITIFGSPAKIARDECVAARGKQNPQYAHINETLQVEIDQADVKPTAGEIAVSAYPQKFSERKLSPNDRNCVVDEHFLES